MEMILLKRLLSAIINLKSTQRWLVLILLDLKDTLHNKVDNLYDMI